MPESIATPAPGNLRTALATLDVPEAIIHAFESGLPSDATSAFGQAVAESPHAVVTDWRFHPADALLEFFLRLYPLGIKGMIEAEEEETCFPTKILIQQDGVGARYQIRPPVEPDLHEIAFALQSVLPGSAQIFSLTCFDGSDTYGHVVQGRDRWDKVRGLLGAWFEAVFSSRGSTLKIKRVGKDVKPKKDFARKHVKDAIDWATRQTEFLDRLHAHDLDVLAKNIDSPALLDPPGVGLTRAQIDKKRPQWHELLRSPERLRLLNFDILGSRAGIAGLKMLWKGDPCGWAGMRLALEYFLWNTVLQIRFFTRRHFGLGDFGNKLALALALGQWRIADYFCEQMPKYNEFFLKDSCLSRFLIELNEIRKGDGPKGSQGFGVYSPILAGWHEPGRLALGLEAACDYHMMRTGDDSEFSLQPFYAFAAELLAVHSVRRECGEETPTIDHQLLNVPWTTPPGQVHLEADDLLHKVTEVLRTESPDLLNLD